MVVVTTAVAEVVATAVIEVVVRGGGSINERPYQVQVRSISSVPVHLGPSIVRVRDYIGGGGGGGVRGSDRRGGGGGSRGERRGGDDVKQTANAQHATRNKQATSNREKKTTKGNNTKQQTGIKGELIDGQERTTIPRAINSMKCGTVERRGTKRTNEVRQERRDGNPRGDVRTYVGETNKAKQVTEGRTRRASTYIRM